MEQVLQAHPSRYIQPMYADELPYKDEAADTICEVTFAAVQGKRHVCWNIFWSYSGTPTGGYIVGVSGPAGAVTAQLPITAGGIGWLRVKVVGRMNQPLTIRLGAGGGAVTGHLHVEQHWLRND